MTTPPDGGDRGNSRTGQLVALVIAVTMILWLFGQWIGGRIGLDPSYVFLLDLAALAAFFWSLVVLFGLWQRQKRAGK